MKTPTIEQPVAQAKSIDTLINRGLSVSGGSPLFGLGTAGTNARQMGRIYRVPANLVVELAHG